MSDRLILTRKGYYQEQANKVSGIYPCKDFRESTAYAVHINIFGGYKEVARPDLIPNSAVKRFIADGSICIAYARVGCRQYFLSDRSSYSGFLCPSRKSNHPSEWGEVEDGSGQCQSSR